MALIGDTESNGFADVADTIHVMCFWDTDKDRYLFSFSDEATKDYNLRKAIDGLIPHRDYNICQDHRDLLSYMSEQEVFTHNWKQHDEMLLKRLFPDYVQEEWGCTYVLSQLINGDRYSHGLEDYGKEFGVPKPKQEQWATFDLDMLNRVIEDVKITVTLYKSLMAKINSWKSAGHSFSKSIGLEYAFVDLIARQQIYGVHIDQEVAYSLANEVWGEVHKVSDTLKKDIPNTIVIPNKVAYEDKPFTKKGEISANVLKWFDNSDSTMVSGKFCRVGFNAINLDSHVQVKAYLLTQGWKPTEYTEKGSPKLTEDSYPSIKGGIGKLVAKRAVLKHRAQMLFNINNKGELKGLINAIRPDGRIGASGATCGTVSSRVTHRVVVNIPKPKDKLWPSGRQIRDVFSCKPNRILMGIDAAGLEARVMCHFILDFPGGEEYTNLVLDGDIHAINSVIFDTDRDGAKAPYYLLMYGGKAKGLAACLGITEYKAKGIYDKFWRESTALSGFRAKITTLWKMTGKKYIIGIDGRKIPTRSEHSLVNLYFQNCGAIIMKAAALYFDKWTKGFDCYQVLHIHDEWTTDIDPKDQEELGRLATKAIEKAGEYFCMRVPMTGSPKFGNTWTEIH